MGVTFTPDGRVVYLPDSVAPPPYSWDAPGEMPPVPAPPEEATAGQLPPSALTSIGAGSTPPPAPEPAPSILPPAVHAFVTGQPQPPVPAAPPIQNRPDFAARAPGDSPYQTPLLPADEAKFQKWVKANKVPFDPGQNADYDMRGFWQALQSGDPRAATAINQADKQLHFPDTWKTPFHKTISNESIYAPPDAPHWIGNVLTRADGSVVADERTAQEKRQQAQQQAIAASPEGQIQAASDEQQAAIKEQQDLLRQRTALDIAKQDELDPIQEQGRRDLEDLRRRRLHEQADYQRGLVDTQKDIDQTTERWRNYHVDKNKFWQDLGPGRSTMAWIMAGISSLGDALQHKSGPNQAVQMILDAVDKHVGLQLKEKESLKEGIGFARDRLGNLRQRYGDWKDAASVEKSIILEQIADRVDATAKKFGGQDALLRGAEMANQIRMKAADQRAEAAEKMWGRKFQERTARNAERQTAIAGGHLALANRTFEYGKEHDKVEDMLNAARLDAAVNAQRAAGNDAAAKELQDLRKENEQRGVNDVVTGNPILQPEGAKMMAQADALDAQAKELAGDHWAPAGKADQLHAQAEALRGEAQIRHQWRVTGAGNSDKLIEQLGSTQTALSLIDDIKQQSPGTGKAWLGKSAAEKNIAAKAQALTLILKDAFNTGTLDKGSQEALDKLTGGDPTKLTVDTVTTWLGNASDTSGALDATADALMKRAVTSAKLRGYKGDARALFQRTDYKKAEDTPQEQSFKAITQEKTPLERAETIDKARAGRSTLGRIGERLFYPFGGGPTSSDAAREAEDSGTVYGLSNKQQADVKQLVSEYKLGGVEAPAAAQKLIDLASKGDRASLASGVRGYLRDNAPDLLQQLGPLSIPVGKQDAESLYVGAKQGSAEAKSELLKRQRAGDKDAARAIIQLIQGR